MFPQILQIFFSCSSSFHNHHPDNYHSLSSSYTKKYHNRNLFLTFREAGKSKIKVPADLVSGASPPPGLSVATMFHHHMKGDDVISFLSLLMRAPS